MYRLLWYCWAILNGGRFGDLRTIYQGCRALPFALAGLSCTFLARVSTFSQKMGCHYEFLYCLLIKFYRSIIALILYLIFICLLISSACCSYPKRLWRWMAFYTLMCRCETVHPLPTLERIMNHSLLCVTKLHRNSLLSASYTLYIVALLQWKTQ